MICPSPSSTVFHANPSADLGSYELLSDSPLHSVFNRLADSLYPDGLPRVFTPEELAERGVNVDLLEMLVRRLEG